MDQTVGMAEARSKLSELVRQAKYGGQTFVLHRRGQPMAVLIGVDEFERLRASAEHPDSDTSSPLSPALLQRQQSLVERAQILRARLGPPKERLAELFADLPPDHDDFWLAIQESA